MNKGIDSELKYKDTKAKNNTIRSMYEIAPLYFMCANNDSTVHPTRHA